MNSPFQMSINFAVYRVILQKLGIFKIVNKLSSPLTFDPLIIGWDIRCKVPKQQMAISSSSNTCSNKQLQKILPRCEYSIIQGPPLNPRHTPRLGPMSQLKQSFFLSTRTSNNTFSVLHFIAKYN